MLKCILTISPLSPLRVWHPFNISITPDAFLEIDQVVLNENAKKTYRLTTDKHDQKNSLKLSSSGDLTIIYQNANNSLNASLVNLLIAVL